MSEDTRALDGLSFEVEAGTVFGMLGPNGAGKSTTVKILTTLSRPDEGQARVGGFDIDHPPNGLGRREVGRRSRVANGLGLMPVHPPGGRWACAMDLGRPSPARSG